MLRIFFWFSMLATLALQSSPLWAQQQPGAITGTVSVGTPLNVTGLDEEDPPPVQASMSLEGMGLATLFADYTHTIDENGLSLSSTYVARADVFGGLRPQASAEASTSAVPSSQGGVLNEGALATAQISYEVMIAELREPPIVFIPPLRLFVDVRAEVSYTGAPNNGATDALVRVSNPSIITTFNRQLQVRLAEEGTDSQAARWGFRARPGDVIRVFLRTRAESAVRSETQSMPAILNSDAIAIADPFFGFDQEAFDADMAAAGLETFPLDEYFGLVYSENLLDSTPRLFRDGFEQ